MAYLAVGDPDRALPYVEAAYRERSIGLLCLRHSGYASRPGFREVIGRLHLRG
jgi:hypothetical protein